MELPKNLYEHLAGLAKVHPSKIALIGCSAEGEITERISYAELLERVQGAAAYLSLLGVHKGDRIALAFKNSPELLILSWTAWATGIVTVPMDTKRDTGEQYQYKISLNKARVLIAQKGALKNIDQRFLEGVRIEEFSGFSQYREIVSPDIWESGVDYLALILFTSGTTGHPKGAMLSLKNLLVNADGIRQWLRITGDDIFLVNLPLHHINSTTFCLSTLLAGGTIAIPPNYSNSHFWHYMAETSATITSVVQSIVFDQLSREKEFASLKERVRLQRIQIGSAPVLPQSVQEFIRRFDIPLYQGYGQTETALRVTGVPMDISKEFYERLVEENSIGEPLAWADLQIADKNGRFLAESEEGELVVKGDANMSGYVGGEEAFREDYFLTGDIGYFKIIDGRKFFYLKGRKREIIIKGGINVSPSAVENHLKKISEDIDQAYVVPVPDERYGEEIGAVICWKDGVDTDAAKRRLKVTLLSGSSYISAYETQKYLTSYALKDLPMTSTGKVQRSVLKERLPYEKFESIYGIVKTPKYRFTVLHRYSRWVQPSFDLYNQCWEPLVAERIQYEKNIPKQLIILAADASDRLLGQIAVIRTNLSDAQLSKTTYANLLTPDVLDPSGMALVCISICSADYKAKPVSNVEKIPTLEEVHAYLAEGNDPVMRFHQKPKGGQSTGAVLVDVIPNGRPEDKSALGYNMLLKYPPPTDTVKISDDAPVSNQLIEVVLMIANDLGIENVYAYSRPGGLASHLSKTRS